MSKAWVFVRDFFCQGLALVGLGLLLVDLAHPLTDLPIGHSVLLPAGGLCLVAAAYLAWREHRRTVSAKDLANLPDLSGEIEQFIAWESPVTQDCQAFILMTVRNRGGPSIVDGWRITVHSEGESMSGSPTFITDGIRLTTTHSEMPVMLVKSDMLSEKTLRPIERGGTQSGWLRFILKGVTADQLRKPGTEVVLSFRDILEHTYEARHLIGSQPIPPQPVPNS